MYKYKNEITSNNKLNNSYEMEDPGSINLILNSKYLRYFKYELGRIRYKPSCR